MKVYKFSEKKPHVNKPFLFVHNAKFYLGTKLDGGYEIEGNDEFYFGPSYELFSGTKKYVRYEEDILFQQALIGDPIFEYWFYLPNFEGFGIEIKVPTKSIFHSFGEEVEVAETSKTSYWNKVEI